MQRLASATEPEDLAQKAVVGARDATAVSGAYIERVISRNDRVEVIAVAGDGTPPLGARSKFPDALPDETIDAIAIAMQRVATLERERHARAQLTRTLEGIADGFISIDRRFACGLSIAPRGRRSTSTHVPDRPIWQVVRSPTSCRSPRWSSS